MSPMDLWRPGNILHLKFMNPGCISGSRKPLPARGMTAGPPGKNPVTGVRMQLLAAKKKGMGSSVLRRCTGGVRKATGRDA